MIDLVDHRFLLRRSKGPSPWTARTLGVVSALVFLLAIPCLTAAESGTLNAHADFGFGAPLTGQLSAPDDDGNDRLLPAGWLALDWQFAAPVAAEIQVGIGRQLERSDTLGARDESFWSASAGIRVRLFDDSEGYGTETAGNLFGNLWLASHVGYFGLDEAEFGVDFAVGYELSVVRPLQVGAFLRGAVVDGGGFDGLHFILWGGLGVSVTLSGGPDAPPEPDRDQDGVTDQAERRRGTDPRAADSDEDGLSDSVEAQWGTDPTNRDTDGDGLTDGEEDRNGNGRRDLDETDPTKADTDGGGVPDGEERIALSDPLDPRDDRRVAGSDEDSDGVANASDRCPSTPPGVPVDEAGCPALAETIRLEGVQFSSGSAEFLPSSAPNLNKALLLLTQHPSLRVEVAGHTDSRGAEWFNRRLSQYRAEAVRVWLIQRGVSPDRLRSRGYGSSEPVASNETDEGRAQNRRIEFRRLPTP